MTIGGGILFHCHAFHVDPLFLKHDHQDKIFAIDRTFGLSNHSTEVIRLLFSYGI